MRRVRTLFGLPAPVRRLFVRALALTTLFRLGLWLLPFSRLKALDSPAKRSIRGDQPCSPARISWAVQTASRYVPGATCLVQALTAKALLERGGYQARLRVGVAKKGCDQFEAHAWVESAGAIVVGGSGVGRYAALLSIEQEGTQES